MSLSYTIDKIENYKEACYTNLEKLQLHYVTQGLIFATISIGTGAITEENAEQFYARLNFWERARGNYLYRPENWEYKDHYFLPAEVLKHVGLTTNAGPIDGSFNESDEEWLGLFTQDLASHRTHYRNELKKLNG